MTLREKFEKENNLLADWSVKPPTIKHQTNEETRIIFCELFDYAQTLHDEIKWLEADKVELLEALQELYDIQNDAPLERDRLVWESAMRKAQRVLEAEDENT